MEKRRQNKRVLLQSKRYIFFGTVFYIRNIKILKKKQKRSLKYKRKKMVKETRKQEETKKREQMERG